MIDTPTSADVIEGMREALEKARTWSDKTGVGCPLCKHEGDQWVEPCGLHHQIHELCIDVDTLRQSSDQGWKIVDAVCKALDVDHEQGDDLIARIEDLKAAAEDVYIVAGSALALPDSKPDNQGEKT